MRSLQKTAVSPTAYGSQPGWLALTVLLLIAAGPALGSTGDQSQAVPLFNLSFTAESYANVAGGKQRGSEGNGVLDATLALTNQDFGWSGNGHWFLDLKHIRGADTSGMLTGDAQVASNIAAPAANRVYELWYQQEFSTAHSWLRAGIIDLNKVFDVVPGSSALNNSSFGIQPTLSLNAPASIYPKPGWSLTGASQLGTAWRLQLGWFQGNPSERSTVFGNGHMLVGELQHLSADDKSLLMLGAWRYAQPHGTGFGNPGSDWGMYLAWSAPLAEAGRRWFAQVGASPSSASVSPYYLEAGYAWQAPFARRPHDQLHFGLARAWIRTTNGMQAETALEANYDLAINRKLTLAPDVQYFLQPAAVSSSDAWVLMLRLYFSLH